MKKFIVFVFFITYLFSFEDSKIENLMGKEKFTTYNSLLSKLKNNGLLELFFDKAKIIHTKFIFIGGENILNTKLLNNSLKILGYYYFYPSEIEKNGKKFILNIEFKSEHFIDPISLIDEMNSRGCKVLDVYKEKGDFTYKVSCQTPNIKEANKLLDTNKRYIKAQGVYWFETNNFSKINIKTRKIDYWHPSVWFYDDKLKLINNVKINKKIKYLTLNIPNDCKYIKIMDIYSGGNFKRGIIIKGLK